MFEQEHETLPTKVQPAKLYQDENLHLAIEKCIMRQNIHQIKNRYP